MLKAKKKKSAKRGLLYAVLIMAAFLMTVPLLWMVLSSLKSESELFAIPLQFLPKVWRFDNYQKLFESAPWGNYFLNTVIVTFFSILGQIICCAMAAFAFARLNFRGKDILFMLYLGTMMVPYQAIMIPQFEVISKLGWIDNHISLIVPAWYSAFGVFLLRQSFMAIPRELEEAAMIDGCSYPMVFYEIVLKNSKPGILALVISVLVGTWNEFLRPLLYINSDRLWTLTMGLQKFQGQYMTQWNQVMAGALVSAIPIIILFVMAQKYFVQGIVMSGLKE